MVIPSLRSSKISDGRVTPLGYFGDPKVHDPNLWKLYEIRAVLMADAVAERVGRTR